MNLIPHLCCHSVAPYRDLRWYRSFLTIELYLFEGLIKYLKKHNYTFLNYDEYLFQKNNNTDRRSRLICLSFDDGYLDNYVFVHPLLKKYDIKATIFVSPEYVQDRNVVRQTLEDVWAGRCKMDDLDSLGFLSWEELKIMQRSGCFDVQSHTMTHTKYFVSDKITDFHNLHSDYLYPVSNVFPELKPYYITDPKFIYLLPFGTPFFEAKSSVVARKIFINQQFVDECVDLLKLKPDSDFVFTESFSKIERLYKSYKESNTLIKEIETENEQQKRVRYEIVESKKIIEEKLKKPVYHCCWPHGVYDDFSLKTALEAGYKTTSIYYNPRNKITDPTLVLRNGFDPGGKSIFLSNMKTIYKINSFAGIFPYNLVQKLFYQYRYQIKV